MFIFMKNLRISVKVAILGIGSALATAAALILLAVWQSAQYNDLAQQEANRLMDADLDHIALGVYNLVRTENEAAQQQVDSNLNVARHVLDRSGTITLSNEAITWQAVNQLTNATTEIQLPRMLVGGQWLGQNTDPSQTTAVVDEVTNLLGETTTLFQCMNEKGDMLRVATTVTTNEGKRAIGTYIPAIGPDGAPSPVITAIQKGETYHGQAFVVNAWYLTAYEPIQDTEGKLVGMLYVGVKQKTVELRVRQALLETKVGTTGYVYALKSTGEDRGHYVVSYKGERDGEDIWNEQDIDGRYIVQEIIKTATALNPGELGTVRYRWQNPGESTPRWKVARLVHFAPWNWVIGTSAYEDELNRDQTVLREGRIRMIGVMCIVGTLITILIGIAGTFIAWTIARPIRQMTHATERVIQGSLDEKVAVHTQDEVGILANTFNFMIDKLKQTLEGLHKSEEKHRVVFDNAIEGIFQTSFEGRFLSVNPALVRILGYDSQDEMIETVTNLRLQLYVHPEDRDTILAMIREQGSVVGVEVELMRKSGDQIWALLSCSVVCDNAGNILFLQGFIIDITDRKCSEKAAQESERRMADIISFLPDATLVIDREGKLIAWNRAIEEMTGIKAKDILGRGNYEYALPFYGKRRPILVDIACELATADDIPYDQFRRFGDVIEGEAYSMSLKGCLRYIYAMASPLRNSNGEIVGAIESIRDITERKRAEDDLRHANMVVENSPVVLFRWIASEGWPVDVVSENVRQFGYSREDFLSGKIVYATLVHPDDIQKIRDEVTLCAENKADHFKQEYRIFTKEGLLRWVDDRTTLMRNATGQVTHYMGTVTDITERKQAEEELRLQSAIVRNMAEGVAMIRAQDAVIIYANYRLEQIFGYAAGDLVGQPVAMLIASSGEETPEAYISGMREQLHHHGESEDEVESIKKDGTCFWCKSHTSTFEHPMFGLVWLTTYEDITERRQAEAERARLEEQLAQAQKMESVGRLAGGVAHDFNNILSVILGHGELMLEGISDDSPLREDVSSIVASGERARDLTRQLLAFSRKQVLDVKILDLNTVVQGMSKMTKRLLGEDINVHIHLRADMADVRADATQLEQVLMNLCVNARDAMPEGGSLTIETDTITLTEHNGPSNVPCGTYIVLSVSDTGCGMDEATQQRVFEPFFTTKEKGKGTGLGLATAYGIVKQHGGEISVSSKPGCGTTFKVYLPQAQASTCKEEEIQEDVVLPGHGETILVVEDEPAVRRMTCLMLTHLGYSVVDAENAEQCMARISNTGPIDLLLTDVIMPGMNGRQLHDHISTICPGLKVLFMSGYTQDVIGHHGMLEEGVHFIPKPFSEKALSQKIRKILGS